MSRERTSIFGSDGKRVCIQVETADTIDDTEEISGCYSSTDRSLRSEKISKQSSLDDVDDTSRRERSNEMLSEQSRLAELQSQSSANIALMASMIYTE